MTIKEFSRLCGCNPQTLRYYDHVDLLKPVTEEGARSIPLTKIRTEEKV